ncbi:SDR family oxidoreductase [Mycolicibacterium sp. CH28]|uniref:SDR family NAD(P)-dependent oxidoreductase n=1 Tax=Mycolicibacterium sp. CH28 TaxID=2512237 RepID=UPI0013870BBD|nr:SDR family oxidoreductase [Mycolicibacterium sp. CH28]
MKLSGAHVLVTGATRGIGLALAEAFAGAGASITAVARPGPRLDELACRGWRTAAADLSRVQDVDGLVDRAASAGGPVDVLVNNAGLNVAVVLRELDADTLRRVLTTNLLAPFELARQALPSMVDRCRGAVVNISSIAGELALRNQVPYCASKSGLTHGTRALQRELRGTGVAAHPVVLGLVATDMIHDLSADPVGGQMAKRFDRLPALDAAVVANRVVRVVERGRGAVVMPALAAPAHYLRLTPTYLTDGLLAGIR